MNLITTKDYRGYLMENIKALLGEDFSQFECWFDGQTEALHEGKPLVYQSDWERFLEGRPEHPLTWD